MVNCHNTNNKLIHIEFTTSILWNNNLQNKLIKIKGYLFIINPMTAVFFVIFTIGG